MPSTTQTTTRTGDGGTKRTSPLKKKRDDQEEEGSVKKHKVVRSVIPTALTSNADLAGCTMPPVLEPSTQEDLYDPGTPLLETVVQTDSLALIVRDPGTVVTTPLVESLSLSHQVAHALGCYSVFYKDLPFHTTHSPRIDVSCKNPPVNGTLYLNVNCKPGIKQTFLGDPLAYGIYMLSPIASLSEVYSLPYGYLDHIKDPNNANDISIEPGKKDTAKVKFCIRPDAYNRFEVIDTSEDVSHINMNPDILESFNYTEFYIENPVRKIMDENPFWKGLIWTPTTRSKDGTSRAEYTEANILKMLDEDDSVADMDAIEKNKYEAITDLWTEWCNKKAKIMNNKLKFYRIATVKERETEPTKPIFRVMDWVQASKIEKGDEVMLLTRISATKKDDKRKVKKTLVAVIWFGASSNYLRMTANTVEEKFKYVPDAPVSLEEYNEYKQHLKVSKEASVTKKAVKSRLDKIRESKGLAE